MFCITTTKQKFLNIIIASSLAIFSVTWAMEKEDIDSGIDLLIDCIHNSDYAGAEQCLTSFNINAQDNNGNTPLIHALNQAIMNRHADFDFIRLLLDRGADPNCKSAQLSLTALELSWDAAIARLLLVYGANPNSQDEMGMTPLMKIAAAGNYNSDSALEKHQILIGAWLLLVYGAKHDLKNFAGKTALDLVPIGPLKKLLQGRSASTSKKVGPPPKADDHHFLWTKPPSPEPIQTVSLIESEKVGPPPKSELGQFLSHARDGHITCVSMLLEKYPSLTISKDRHHRTALLAAAIEGRAEVIAYLLKYGAQAVINQRDSQGWTPLIAAARWGSLQSVKLLVKNGAEINLACKQNLTPLMHAKKLGNEEVIQYLLEQGASYSASAYPTHKN